MDLFEELMKNSTFRQLFTIEEITENFLNKIDQILIDRKITRKMFAEKMNCSYSNIKRIMQARNKISIPTMVKIADVLDLEIKLKLIERKNND